MKQPPLNVTIFFPRGHLLYREDEGNVYAWLLKRSLPLTVRRYHNPKLWRVDLVLS